MDALSASAPLPSMVVPATVASSSPPLAAPSPPRFEKPFILYTKPVVKVAGYALAGLAAVFTARAFVLVVQGVSVLTRDSLVSVALLTLGGVAFYYCRTQFQAQEAKRQQFQAFETKRQETLEYIRQSRMPDGTLVLLERFPFLSYDEVCPLAVGHQTSADFDLKNFCYNNGPRALQYLSKTQLKRYSGQYLEVVGWAYIHPGFEEFKKASLLFKEWIPDIEAKLQTEIEKAEVGAKERFLKFHKENDWFPYGGALVLAEDPGKRLGLTYEDVVSMCGSNHEYKNPLDRFVQRNGWAAFKYVPNRYNFAEHIRGFVITKKLEQRDVALSLSLFIPCIEAICQGRPHLQPQLTNYVRIILEKGAYEALIDVEFQISSFETFLEWHALPSIKCVTNVALLQQKFLDYVVESCQQEKGLTVAHFRRAIAAISDNHRSVNRGELEKEVSNICARHPAPSKATIIEQLQRLCGDLSNGGIFVAVEKPEVIALGLDRLEVFRLLADAELEKYDWETFIERNGSSAIGYVTNTPLLEQKFLAYVEKRCQNSGGLTWRDFEKDARHLNWFYNHGRFRRKFIDQGGLSEDVVSICRKYPASRP